MTTAVTHTTDESAPRQPWERRRGALGVHVAETVYRLQRSLLATPPRSDAVASLAKLRRGIGKTPGFDYTLEDYLAMPVHLLGFQPSDSSLPTSSEQAKHDAMTLYALHQQSQRQPMHLDRRGLGTAIAELIRVSDGPDGIRRRFASLGTATSYSEAVYHLRSLITMLRGAGVALDYGLLADDLLTLQRPGGRAQMQATWGRELFRNRSTDSGAGKAELDDSDTDSTHSTEETMS